MSFLKWLNRFFPAPVHPFNLQNDGKKTYAQWQFEKGGDTVKYFTGKYPADVMFKGKRVLDMGCGGGGKSLYYVSMGAAFVTGIEIVERYRQDADALAAQLGFSDRFRFVCASATELPFEKNSFDTVIMNDFMEHVSQPEEALEEALRVLAPGGRVYINFPPYYHPFGAHLSDAIYIPWVHMLFSEPALYRAYKDLVAGKPDGEERLSFRFSFDEKGRPYISYINKMTLKKFHRILKSLSLTPEYYHEEPLRGFMAPLAKIPGVKEPFVKMGVCVIAKSAGA